MSTLWWALGVVAFAVLTGLDPGTVLTARSGYLNSQYFATVLPAVYLIFGIGIAAWTVAGDEESGTLELLLVNPVSRVRVALARAAGVVVLLAILALASLAALAVLAPPFLTDGLGLAQMAAATVATALLALTFASMTFLVGAASGRRSLAISVSAALAVAGFVIEGVAAQVEVLQPIRAISPWHWALGADPLRNGLTWQSGLLPLGVSLLLLLSGAFVLGQRDLR
jgi:ABC-2 type transport system permease protein